MRVRRPTMFAVAAVLIAAVLFAGYAAAQSNIPTPENPERIAELGDEQLQLELNPIKSDADISKTKEPEHRKFRSTIPTEIAASTDASYEESIPKGYQKIVKSYFREITR